MKTLILFLLPLSVFGKCVTTPCIEISDEQEVVNFYMLKDELIKRHEQQKTIDMDTTIKESQDEVIEFAHSYIGTPYVFGGESRNGIDCSAFIRSVFREFGYNLPRTSREQYRDKRLKNVNPGSLEPLDLLFFTSPNRTRINHVAMYIGDGKMIHSSRSENGVFVTNVNFSLFWSNRFYGAKRPIFIEEK